MKQTFVKAAVLACCMAAVGCKQAPMTMGPGEYAVMTIATTDREIPSNYSATIRGRQDIAIYPQVSGTISQLCVNEGQKVAKGQTLFIIDQVPYKAAPANRRGQRRGRQGRRSHRTAHLRQQEGAFRPQRRFAVRPLDGQQQPADGQGPARTGRGTARERRQQPLLYGREGSDRRRGGNAAVPRRRAGERFGSRSR